MAAQAQDIVGSPNRLARTVSHSFSISPTATFHSPPSSFGGAQLTRTLTAPKSLKPFDTQDIKILLLENINQSGRDILASQGYQVEALKTSLPEDQLIEKIRWGNSVPCRYWRAIANCVTIVKFMSSELDQRQSSLRESCVKQRI